MKKLSLLLLFASACAGSLRPKMRPGSNITLPAPNDVIASTLAGLTCAKGNAGPGKSSEGRAAACPLLDTLPPRASSPPVVKPR